MDLPAMLSFRPPTPPAPHHVVASHVESWMRRGWAPDAAPATVVLGGRTFHRLDHAADIPAGGVLAHHEGRVYACTEGR